MQKITPRWLNVSQARRAHPEECLQPFVSVHKPPFIIRYVLAEERHTFSRWKTEPSFVLLPPSPPSIPDWHRSTRFTTKAPKMFSRLDGSSRCVAAPSASWIASWQPRFNFWNINKALRRIGWQDPAASLPFFLPSFFFFLHHRETLTCSFLQTRGRCSLCMDLFEVQALQSNFPVSEP